MKQLIMAGLAVSIIAGVSGIAIAQPGGNVYSNKFVGLNFSVPENWYISTDIPTMEITQDAARVMGLDNPAAQEMAAQVPGKVLLIVSEWPLDSGQVPNPNIIVMAISAREIRDEMSSGADYLGQVARSIREAQTNATVSDIATQQLGGEEFHRLDVAFTIEDVSVHASQLARIHNDYIVVLNLSAGSDSGLANLVQIADGNLRLSAVSQDADSSPEGQSFREQTSIKSPGLSDINPLKTIGLVLMVLGGFWVLKGSLNKK